MKLKHTLTALAASVLTTNAASVTWGGPSTIDVDNWTTSDAAFDDTVQSGHALNWENVLTNTSTTNSVDNRWDFTMTSNTNHTIGHLYMLNQSFDLSTTAGGIETLSIIQDLEASANSNWSAVVSITGGGATTFYRWNHGGNTFKSNNLVDYSLGGTFDLSQLGNGTNTATGIWGELNSAATGFGGTRDNDTGPNLQATSGTLSVGFLQWGASTGGAANIIDGTLAVESFEVEIGFTAAVPEPSSVALIGLAGLGLLRRRRK
ncbi:MAG: PEP-CTERM sorting domain-containing protein [Akkermansiaceae bacterium]